MELSCDSIAAVYPRSYAVKDTISEKDIWVMKNDHVLFFQAPTYYLSNFVNNGDNFVGFRFINQNDTVYGWIDISFHFQSSYKI